MVNDIINAFENEFNSFAESGVALSYSFERDGDSYAIGTLKFSDFSVHFEYSLECGMLTEKSGLGIVLDLSRKSDLPLQCMMYDIIGFIDRKNFNCWFYCYIENESRMKLCFDKLAQDFLSVLPQLRQFISEPDNIKALKAQLTRDIGATVGTENVFEELKQSVDNEDDVSIEDAFDYMYSLYFNFERTLYASAEYGEFLSGNAKKALKKYAKKKNRLAYEDHMLEHLQSGEHTEPILTEEYECLKGGLKAVYGKGDFLPFLAAWGILFIPFTVIAVALYYLLGLISYSSALYATALESYNLMECIIPAEICAMAAGFFIRKPVYRKLFKKRYRRLMDYDAILNTEKSEKHMRVLFILVYIFALVWVFLAVNNGVAFSDNGVRDKSGYFNVVGEYYSYDEVYSAECVKGRYDYPDYILTFDNGESVNLSDHVGEEEVENKIAPILSEHGITFEYLE